MNKEEKRYLKSKMNEYVNKFCNRNKIDDKFASVHEIRRAFKLAFTLSYKLFMNRNNFWEPRYWILNGVYVKAMEADAEYLGKLKKENEELREEIKAKQVVLNDFKSRVETVTDRFDKKSSRLNKAKDIIKKFLLWENDWHNKTESKYELLNQAEQFLKEE